VELELAQKNCTNIAAYPGKRTEHIGTAAASPLFGMMSGAVWLLV